MINISTEIENERSPRSEDELARLQFQASLIGQYFSRSVKRNTVVGLSNKVAPDYFLMIVPDQKNSHCEIRAYVDFEKVFTLPALDQKAYLTDTIFSHLKRVVEKYHGDLPPLFSAYELFKDSHYECVYSKKPKSSPDRKHKAKIKINMDADGAKVHIVYYNKEKEIKDIMVANLWPNFFFIGPLVHDGYWVDNLHFAIRSKDDEIHFKTSLTSNDVEILFFPKTKSLDELKLDMELAYFRKTKEVREKYGHL